MNEIAWYNSINLIIETSQSYEEKGELKLLHKWNQIEEWSQIISNKTANITEFSQIYVLLCALCQYSYGTRVAVFLTKTLIQIVELDIDTNNEHLSIQNTKK